MDKNRINNNNKNYGNDQKVSEQQNASHKRSFADTSNKCFKSVERCVGCCFAWGICKPTVDGKSVGNKNCYISPWALSAGKMDALHQLGGALTAMPLPNSIVWWLADGYC